MIADTAAVTPSLDAPLKVTSGAAVQVKPVSEPAYRSTIHAVDPKILAKPNVGLWVTKDHRIYQKESPFPGCPPGQCVVHVRATGICGTEIHYWKHGAIGEDSRVEEDLILGHESAGQIVQVGEGVEGFSVGDRVSIEPGISCWDCDECMSGRYNICPNVAFSGGPPCHGTMRRFVAHPARYLHKIPDEMSYELGALVEPLSVAYHAVLRGAPTLGQPVVVAGAGPIGLAVAICARAAGCHPVCITDLDPARLAQANAFGFDRTVKVELDWDRRTTADKVRGVMGEGCVPALAWECTGAASSLNSAIVALRPGGTVVQVGCGHSEVSVPLMPMVFREINLVTSFRYKQSWPTVIRLAADGVFGEVEKMITHRLAVESTLEAFDTCVDKSKMAIKVQIVDEE